MNKKVDEIANFGKFSLEKTINAYEYSYMVYPKITNYLSSALGTVGGDIIAKQFTENPDVKLRDIVFTGIAASVYSYLAPKMIDWSTKFSDNIKTQTIVLTAMYFPVNMLYWNYLTIKNEASITLEDNILGAITLGIATIPYLYADYIAIKKFSQEDTKKFLRPFYSGVELVWNMIFAGGNYLAKRF